MADKTIGDLARRSSNGDLYLNLAQQLLDHQEWGLARKAVENALARETLSDRGGAEKLKVEIESRLGQFTTKQ